MKKGQTTRYLVVLVLALLFAVILALVFKRIAEATGEKADIEICRNSFKIAESAMTYTGFWTKLDCPYTPKEINYKDTSRTKAKQIIAKELTDCWYKTLGIYGHKVFNKWFDNHNACFVCGEFILFGEDLKISTKEMGEFLNEPTIKDATVSWSDLLDTDWAVGKENRQFFLGVDKVGKKPRLRELDNLEPGTKYMVMYIYFDNYWIDDELFRGGVPNDQYKKITREPYLVDTTARKYITKGDSHHAFIIPTTEVANFPDCQLFYKKIK